MPHPYEPTSLGQLTEAYYRRHVTERAAALGIRERDLFAHIAEQQALLPTPVDIHPHVHTLWTGTKAAA